MTSHFKQRLLMSSVGIVFIILTIYFSYTPLFTPFFVLLNAGVISFALLEYYHLTRHKGFQPLVGLGIGTTTAYVIASFLSIRHPHLATLPFLILLVAAILYFLAFFNQQPNPIGNIAITMFGIVYLTIPLTCGLQINYFFPPGVADDGRLWLAYILTVTKMTDVGAYICGKILGKTKIAPHISPKKTIEGAIGGLVASLLTSLAFYLFLLSPPIETLMSMNLWQSIWLGLVISILAQLGDLAESILKRDAGVKDSSQLPGLGGMLDIVDSLIFTLPLMYLWLKKHV